MSDRDEALKELNKRFEMIFKDVIIELELIGDTACELATMERLISSMILAYSKRYKLNPYRVTLRMTEQMINTILNATAGEK